MTDSSKTLVIDIDGVCTFAPDFFVALTRTWPGRVVIMTARTERGEAIVLLAELGIVYDELLTNHSPAEKIEAINLLDPMLVFEDNDAVVAQVSARVLRPSGKAYDAWVIRDAALRDM